jgi:hypothetical protein
MTTGHQPKPGATPPAPPTTGSGVRPPRPTASAPAAAPGAQDAAQAIELAYGLIWYVPVDKATEAGRCVSLARLALLEQLDRDGQARGITAARKMIERQRESRKNSRTDRPELVMPLTAKNIMPPE